MRTEGWEERLRELDEVGMAFNVAQRITAGVQGSAEGWLRRVRQAVDVPAAEVAGRMGLAESQVYRMEMAESRGVIELQTLRKAAEALGCEVVYGLAPKEGTLAGMSAAIKAKREQRRVEAKARKSEKERRQRHEAAKNSWRTKERERRTAQWLRFWDFWGTEMPDSLRRQIPKPVKEMPFWREQMRKALRKTLRENGIRLR